MAIKMIHPYMSTRYLNRDEELAVLAIKAKNKLDHDQFVEYHRQLWNHLSNTGASETVNVHSYIEELLTWATKFEKYCHEEQP